MCQHPRRIPAPFKWVRPTQLIGDSFFSAFPYPFAWSFPAFLGVGVFLFPFPTCLCPFLVISARSKRSTAGGAPPDPAGRSLGPPGPSLPCTLRAPSA